MVAQQGKNEPSPWCTWEGDPHHETSISVTKILLIGKGQSAFVIEGPQSYFKSWNTVVQILAQWIVHCFHTNSKLTIQRSLSWFGPPRSNFMTSRTTLPRFEVLKQRGLERGSHHQTMPVISLQNIRKEMSLQSMYSNEDHKTRITRQGPKRLQLSPPTRKNDQANMKWVVVRKHLTRFSEPRHNKAFVYSSKPKLVFSCYHRRIHVSTYKDLRKGPSHPNKTRTWLTGRISHARK